MLKFIFGFSFILILIGQAIANTNPLKYVPLNSLTHSRHLLIRNTKKTTQLKLKVHECDTMRMCVIEFLMGIMCVSVLTLALCAESLPENHLRLRREGQTANNGNDGTNTFDKEDVGWTNINEEVDMVTPMILEHLQKLGIEHLQLPDMKESISVPLFITYEAGLFLTNGIVYNLSGVKRHRDAFMTYEGKSFLCRFYLKISNLEFEYNFLLKLMAIEGYGKVIGSLEDTIIYAELAVNVITSRLHLNDFRIIEFSKIHVQLDQARVIRQLTGLILSPITNLFKDRITTSIADGLKAQMQLVMDDFNNEDPLELRQFTKKLLAGLTGQPGTDSDMILAS